jgi:hypothetical protein
MAIFDISVLNEYHSPLPAPPPICGESATAEELPQETPVAPPAGSPPPLSDAEHIQADWRAQVALAFALQVSLPPYQQERLEDIETVLCEWSKIEVSCLISRFSRVYSFPQEGIHACHFAAEGPGVALDMDDMEMALVQELKKFEKIVQAMVLSWKKTWEEVTVKGQAGLATKASAPANVVGEPMGVIVVKALPKAKAAPQNTDMGEPVSIFLSKFLHLSLILSDRGVVGA